MIVVAAARDDIKLGEDDEEGGGEPASLRITGRWWVGRVSGVNCGGEWDVVRRCREEGAARNVFVCRVRRESRPWHGDD